MNKNRIIKQKGFAEVLILVLVLLIGVAAGGYYFWGKQDRKQSKETLPVPVQKEEQAIGSSEELETRDVFAKSFGYEIWAALDRYFRIFSSYPWDTLGEPQPSGTRIKTSWLDEVIRADELKPGVKEIEVVKDLYVTENEENVVSVCFKPVSQRYRAEADAAEKNKDASPGCTQDCWICTP